jgi:prepilin-type N-terminal cleavage/methylation domain-containing protein
MNTPRRQAFTLVELLVVITIIGMLVALLLPAVNSARESARQTTCMNNQRSFGQALLQYVTAKEYFPGYRRDLVLNDGSRIVVAWQVMLLPNMSKQDVFDALKGKGLQAFPYLDFSICPSDNTISGKTKASTSYVANCGRFDAINTSTGAVNVADSPTNAESFNNGIFQDCVLSRNAKFSLTDIKDGQPTTLMLSENIDAGFYSDGPGSDSETTGYPLILNTSGPQANWPSVWAGQMSSSPPHNCSERGCGFVWWDNSKTNSNNPPTAAGATPDYPVQAINGKAGDYDVGRLGWWAAAQQFDISAPGTNQTNHAARPASNHPGGVITTFAGGNTKFLADGIDYGIYSMLMTPNGAKSPTKSHDALTPQKSWQFYYPISEGQF